MNQLWAPWRIKYIQKIPKNKKKCIFCAAYRRKNKKEKVVLLKTAHSLAMLNLFPYNNGHIMIAPKKHIRDLDKLTELEICDIFALIKKLTSVLKKILKPQGFNIGINIGKSAGAGFDKHLHIHIVPRWVGDTGFISVCTDTKVISQSLNELHKKIKKCLREKR